MLNTGIDVTTVTGLMWRQARSGEPDRINALSYSERIFKMEGLHKIIAYGKWDS